MYANYIRELNCEDNSLPVEDGGEYYEILTILLRFREKDRDRLHM